MTGPHLDQSARDVLDGDHALVTDPAGDDDNKEKALGRCGSTAEGRQNQLNHQVEKGSSMTVPPTPSRMPVAQECRYCTVPTDRDDVCGFCQRYVPPATAVERESVDGYIRDAAKHARYAVEDLGDAAEVAAQPVLPEARELLLAALRLLDEAAE